MVTLLGWTSSVSAQHFWWDLKGHQTDTCLYGQITVLTTHEHTYFCGANWHAGEPAGGYCGIQNNTGEEHRTIFSIWDTAPKLHPTAAAFDSRTQVGRFGGEGEGGHTHMIWPWKVRQTFEFFVQKVPGTKPDTTDARYYIYDIEKKTWIHSATITSPNGGFKAVTNLGGSINSFLENFSGHDKSAPRLALYRLWMGPNLTAMAPLTRGAGDGKWGILHDAYFLAQGDAARLQDVFTSLQADYGKPTFPGKDVKLPPLSETPMSPSVVKALVQITGSKQGPISNP